MTIVLVARGSILRLNGSHTLRPNVGIGFPCHHIFLGCRITFLDNIQGTEPKRLANRLVTRQVSKHKLMVGRLLMEFGDPALHTQCYSLTYQGAAPGTVASCAPT